MKNYFLQDRVKEEGAEVRASNLYKAYKLWYEPEGAGSLNICISRPPCYLNGGLITS